MKELSESVEKQKTEKNMQISPHVFEILRKELGDYEIVLWLQ